MEGCELGKGHIGYRKKNPRDLTDDDRQNDIRTDRYLETMLRGTSPVKSRREQVEKSQRAAARSVEGPAGGWQID